MHDGVADTVYDGLVHLSVLPHQGELDLFPQLFAHVAHDPMHFLERPGDRDHAQGHGNILKLIRKFAELTGGFGEGIQLEPLQVRRGGEMCIRDRT